MNKKQQDEKVIDSDEIIRTTNNNNGRGKHNDGEINIKDDNEDDVWYFSYGSNMSYEVFVKRRGISTIKESRKCILPGYTLSYEHEGFGYYEPAFATCVKQEDYFGKEEKRPDIHGVAFLISQSDFEKMLATEGGNGWNDGSCGGYRVSDIKAIEYYDNDTNKEGRKFTVRTLTNLPNDNRHSVSWKNCPSLRYKNLVVNGAKDSGLDSKYITWLELQPAYDDDNDQYEKKNKYGKLLALPFVRPCFRFWDAGQAIFVHYLQMKRYPWIFARCFYLYHKCVLIKAIIPMIEYITGTNAYYHNNDDYGKNEIKKKKDN